MYKHSQLLNFLVFDMEAKPKWPSFDAMPLSLQKIWLEKHHFKAYEKEIEARRKAICIERMLEKENEEDQYLTLDDISISSNLPSVNDIYIKEAGLHPEFAEVYCISYGFFEEDMKTVTVSTFAERSEKETIESFVAFLHEYPFKLAGYNIIDYDIPFLLRRMWMNGIVSNYPPQLQLKNAKPWTVESEDHMTNWKAGMWAPVSLGLVCEVMGVPSPKDEFENHEFTTLLMSGKITKEDAIRYCEKDVRSLMQVMLKMATEDNNFEKAPSFGKSFSKAKA